MPNVNDRVYVDMGDSVGDFEITGTVVEIDYEMDTVWVREDGTGLLYDVDLNEWSRVAEILG